MPEINTMCVPHNEGMNEPDSPCIPLDDLQHTRQQVVDIVMNAPGARIDNMISKVSDSAQMLLVHSRVVNALKYNVSRMNRMKWMSSVFTALFGAAVTAGLW